MVKKSQNNKKQKSHLKILFFAPHADDVEVMSSSICQAAVNGGFEVHENLSCADEYGTLRTEFRGRRLARIRKFEMDKAAKTYGINPDGTSKIILHWMPYIDGFVPFNREIVNRFKNLILELKPFMVIGPDPFFPQGPHPDHLATGKSLYFALKELSPSDKPKYMFFNQTFMGDFCFPYLSSEIEFKARMGHRSQWSELIMKLFGKASHFWKRTILNHGKRADVLRTIKFDNNEHEISENKWLVLKRLKRGFFHYSFKIGSEGPEYFMNPSVDEILKDYEKNGWV